MHHEMAGASKICQEICSDNLRVFQEHDQSKRERRRETDIGIVSCASCKPRNFKEFIGHLEYGDADDEKFGERRVAACSHQADRDE